MNNNKKGYVLRVEMGYCSDDSDGADTRSLIDGILVVAFNGVAFILSSLSLEDGDAAFDDQVLFPCWSWICELRLAAAA